MATIISTWPFSIGGVEKASSVLQSTGDPLDAVETGILVVEEDPTVMSAGYGGLPNVNGELQLDAALMTSDGEQGAVMAVNSLRSAITPARHVLHHSPHAMLAGEGALDLALRYGAKKFAPDDCLTPHARRRFFEYTRYKEDSQAAGDVELHHGGDASCMSHTDTVGMLACLGDGGALAAGCATSGTPFKHKGRVGDSPVFGAGLFADKCGAASASGDGDRMLRYCLSFLIVEGIRMGHAPQHACEIAIRRLKDDDAAAHAAVIALDAKGAYGAAATHNGFSYVVWSETEGLRTVKIRGESPIAWTHRCV